MLGKNARKILLRAYENGGWIPTPGQTPRQKSDMARAARRLVEHGLVERAVRDFDLPGLDIRITRAAVRLTETGETFCRMFLTAIRNGTRIRSSRFAKETGMQLTTFTKNAAKPLPPAFYERRARQATQASAPQ